MLACPTAQEWTNPINARKPDDHGLLAKVSAYKRELLGRLRSCDWKTVHQARVKGCFCRIKVAQALQSKSFSNPLLPRAIITQHRPGFPLLMPCMSGFEARRKVC